MRRRRVRSLPLTRATGNSASSTPLLPEFCGLLQARF
jgi:hypothetical protein